jgi:hypothetical protein
MTDLINASEEFPIFLLLASIDFLSLKYRATPSNMIASPISIRGVSAIRPKFTCDQVAQSRARDEKVEACPDISEQCCFICEPGALDGEIFPQY